MSKNLEKFFDFTLGFVSAWVCFYIAYNGFAYDNNLAPMSIWRSLVWMLMMVNAVKAIKSLWKV